MPLVANERFAPKDTSVVGQALKLIAAKPDAVVIGASGTPAALPAPTLVERGYKGKMYFNHGVANNDFLRVGGKDVEGAFVPASPVIVACAAARLPSGEEDRDGIHQGSTRRLRRRQRRRVRLLHLGRVPRTRQRDSCRAQDRAAGHEGVSPRAARRDRGDEGPR